MSAIDPRKIFAEAQLSSDASIRWRVARTLPYFDGHFPGIPILPAVAIVDATVVFAEKITGRRWQLADVSQAKFSRPIVPENEVRVVVVAIGDGQFQASWFVAGSDERLADLTVRLVADMVEFTC